MLNYLKDGKKDYFYGEASKKKIYKNWPKFLNTCFLGFATIIIFSFCQGSKLSRKVDLKIAELQKKKQINDGEKIEGISINDRKLNSKDFRGKPPEKKKGIHTLGQISCKVNYYYNNKREFENKYFFNFIVINTIVPEYSWISKTDEKETLRHEQIHYDLYRVASLEIKSALSARGYSINNYRSEISEVYNKIMEKYAAANNKFDFEVFKDESKVREWEEKVKRCIENGFYED